jgi:regulator of RNase E activity RraA
MAGELVARQCLKRGGAGLVIDGAMRDGEALLGLDLPMFCHGLVPRGPVKEFGGFIDVPVGFGGVAISPGDLLIGDADGVTVVPLALAAATLQRCREQLSLEDARVAAIANGELIADLFRVQQPEFID